MKYFQIFALSIVEGIMFIFLTISGPHIWNSDVAFGQYPVINGIRCDKTEHFNFHYHAHLDIFINGVSYAVPAGIGIKPPDCIYWLHTHDVSE